VTFAERPTPRMMRVTGMRGSVQGVRLRRTPARKRDGRVQRRLLGGAEEAGGGAVPSRCWWRKSRRAGSST